MKKTISAIIALLMLSSCSTLAKKVTTTPVAVSLAVEEKVVDTTPDGYGCWPFDFTNPTEVLNHATHVLHIRVKDAGVSYYDKDRNPGLPFTKYTVEVLQVIKGEPVDQEITLTELGGITSLKEYRENISAESAEKQGLNALSDEDAANRSYKFRTESSYQLDAGQEYVAFLTYVDGYLHYMPSGDGYAFYTFDSAESLQTSARADSMTKIELTNVLSNEKLILQDRLTATE